MSNLFGDAIREIREDYGWTQARCAEYSGLADAAWSQWETGRRLPTLINFGYIVSTFSMNSDQAMQLFELAMMDHEANHR